MNLYEIQTNAELQFFQDKLPMGATLYSTGELFEWVFAETRGKAKYLFVDKHSHMIEWTTHMSISLIARNVEHEAGVVETDKNGEIVDAMAYDLIDRHRVSRGHGMNNYDRQSPCIHCGKWHDVDDSCQAVRWTRPVEMAVEQREDMTIRKADLDTLHNVLWPSGELILIAPDAPAPVAE